MKIAIVGAGGSAGAYLVESAALHYLPSRFDEVWAVGPFVASYIRHDVVVCMDPLEEIPIPEIIKFLRGHNKPIYTSRAHPDFPTAVDYPLDAVVTDLQDDLLNNSGVMALALAIVRGPEEISVYGLDYNWPGLAAENEKGGQAAAYLIGLARGRGIHVRLPVPTALLDAYSVREIDGKARRVIYGYSPQPEMGHLPPARGIDGAPQ